MNKLCGLNQMASADCSKWAASQFCSVPWVSDTLGSVLVCKQPKGVKPKITNQTVA